MLGSTISPLVVVNLHRDHRESVTQALWSVTTVEFIDYREIDRFLGKRLTAAGFLMALGSTRRLDIESAIRQVRRISNGIPIIAYATKIDDWAALAVAAIQSGADHLAVHGFDDLRRVVGHALGNVWLAAACMDTVKLVLPWVPPRAHRIVELCTLHAAQHTSVLEVADRAGLSTRSLNRLLGALDLPPAAATISWCRLFVAVYLMVRERQRVDQVAGALGFASGSGLRNMLRRYTGLTPTAIREGDAVSRLARLYSATEFKNVGDTEVRDVRRPA